MKGQTCVVSVACRRRLRDPLICLWREGWSKENKRLLKGARLQLNRLPGRFEKAGYGGTACHNGGGDLCDVFFGLALCKSCIVPNKEVNGLHRLAGVHFTGKQSIWGATI